MDRFDREKDSLYVLPLSMIPLKTRGLRHARLLKNGRLQGVVELFCDTCAGSGRIEVDALAGEFGWPEQPAHPDLTMLRGLSRLSSYDVYSLRVLLRDLDIAVDNVDDLTLSAEKSGELTAYMRVFTGPLIRQVYGDADVSIRDFGDIIGLFKHADAQLARQKLERLSRKLGLSLAEVPRFLEDFADIFLSLSYYRSYLDNIQPKVGAFVAGLDEFRHSHELRQSRLLMKTCDELERCFTELTSRIGARFQDFDRATEDMWANISAESFRRVEALIISYHTTIGGLLCALGTKMNAWEERFPNGSSAGLLKRADFIMTDMRPGLEHIRLIEGNAPMTASHD